MESLIGYDAVAARQNGDNYSTVLLDAWEISWAMNIESASISLPVLDDVCNDIHFRKLEVL